MTGSREEMEARVRGVLFDAEQAVAATSVTGTRADTVEKGKGKADEGSSGIIEPLLDQMIAIAQYDKDHPVFKWFARFPIIKGIYSWMRKRHVSASHRHWFPLTKS